MKLMLAEPFKSLWAGRDPFAEVEGLEGEVYRELEARRTLRTEVDGHGFFVKIHRGIGWGEIFKNLLTAKRGSVRADLPQCPGERHQLHRRRSPCHRAVWRAGAG